MEDKNFRTSQIPLFSGLSFVISNGSASCQWCSFAPLLREQHESIWVQADKQHFSNVSRQKQQVLLVLVQGLAEDLLSAARSSLLLSRKPDWPFSCVREVLPMSKNDQSTDFYQIFVFTRKELFCYLWKDYKLKNGLPLVVVLPLLCEVIF